MSRLLDLSKPWIIKKFQEEADVTELTVAGPVVIWSKKRTPGEIEYEKERFAKDGYEEYLYSVHITRYRKGQFNRVNTIE